ncbi:hypothetical protein B472_12435 [Limnohabitans sp. Rim28]|nr:hypothetical protein B472_12435 [Limnohabitans sp. Rim28]
METAGACFERCPGQAPAEVLMLEQLEASTSWIVSQSQQGVAKHCFDRPEPFFVRHGFKPQFNAPADPPRLLGTCIQ